jgi:hypothetical protein
MTFERIVVFAVMHVAPMLVIALIGAFVLSAANDRT